MARKTQHGESVPLRFTAAQRKIVGELLPELAPRLKVGQGGQRTIDLTPGELQTLQQKATDALGQAAGAVRQSLRLISHAAGQAVDRWREGKKVYQFKITLLDAHTPIWRRIQIHGCTLDKLHEHVQTAMGWTNSHLHDFMIGTDSYGDPLLMAENFEEFNYKDSTTTYLSQIVPKSGKRFRFTYQYDFGDSWQHEILFEGGMEPEADKQYPLCIGGARACPPEDVGGVWGYADFVESIQNENDERHDELLEWVGGAFDPEVFDPAEATRRMRRGLPDWRRLL